MSLREEYLAAAAGSKPRLVSIIDLVFANPFITVKRVEQATGLTNQGARNLVRDAERRGWLAEVGTFGRGGATHWVDRRVFRVIEAPSAYDLDVDGAV